MPLSADLAAKSVRAACRRGMPSVLDLHCEAAAPLSLPFLFPASPTVTLLDLWHRQDHLAIPFHLAAKLKPDGMSISAGRTLTIGRVGHLVAAYQLDLVKEAHEQLVCRPIIARGVKHDRVGHHTIHSL
jgi:hypothetical protein